MCHEKKNGLKQLSTYIFLKNLTLKSAVLFFPLSDVEDSKVSDHTKENPTRLLLVPFFFFFEIISHFIDTFLNFLNYKAYNITFLILMIRKYLWIHVWRNICHGVHTEVGHVCGVSFPFCQVRSRNQTQAMRLSSKHPYSLGRLTSRCQSFINV